MPHCTTPCTAPQIVLAVDMFALLMYNVSGMLVTGHLGAVFRTVLETTRTLFVWLVSCAGPSRAHVSRMQRCVCV